MRTVVSVLLAGVLMIGAAYSLQADEGSEAAQEYQTVLDDLDAMGRAARTARSQQRALDILRDMEVRLVAFRKAYAETPESYAAAYQLGSLKVSMGGLTREAAHYTQAAGYLSEFLSNVPPDVSNREIAIAHYYLAEALKNTGRFDEAEREYRVVLDQFGSVNARLTQIAQGNLRDLAIQRQLAIGKDAIPFEVKGIDGEKISPARYKGKVLLIDFWATWCMPCKAEMPNVKRVYQKYRNDGFEIVGISLDRSRSDLDRYLASQKIEWPQFFDGKFWQNEVATQYGVKSIPATYLLDRKGKIRYKSLRGKQLEVAIQKLLKESM